MMDTKEEVLFISFYDYLISDGEWQDRNYLVADICETRPLMEITT